MSYGRLPEIKQQLGEVDGTPALITDLKAHDWEPWTKLWIYTAVQDGSDNDALVRFSKREVPWEEVTLVDGHYVLKGEEFADDMKGWALVLVKGERCSPQTIATYQVTKPNEYKKVEKITKLDSEGYVDKVNI